MSEVIYFFKWLLRGIREMGAWLVSVPAILVSSVVGMYVSIQTLITSLAGDSSTILNEAVSSASSSITSISNVVNSFPDIVKVAFYALSLDVAYRFVLAAFFLFVGSTVLVLEFQLVTFLGWNLALMGFRMVAWFINAFFPSAASISGIKGLSNAETPELTIDV